MRVVGAWVAALVVLGLATAQAEESVALSGQRRCGQLMCYSRAAGLETGREPAFEEVGRSVGAAGNVWAGRARS